ncbi:MULTISPECIES: ABA4-like family protein [Methylomonas]|nr:ABA4-like family protein [Methylomonas koyamae]
MPESAFSIVSIAAMAAWLGLAVAAPLRAGRTRENILFVSGRVAPLLLCTAYVAFLARYWGSTPGGGFQSLEAVQILFAAPGKMLGAWTHFLAFDLLVGRWLVDDASSEGNSRLPLVIALPATFLFGPLGVLLYLAGRALLSAKRARAQ